MPMDSGEPIPLEMLMGDPIALMSKEEEEAAAKMRETSEEKQ